MINITLENNRELFQDYTKCLDFLSKINYDDYQYPEGITNFHVYSEVKTDKELLCIESYLATQNLEKTKLVLWSDYDVTDNPLLQPYKHLIDMRVYNVREELKGTILENNEKCINASDTRHYMKSGVLRFLVTHKYGGIWADMDMVFINDFKPILDQEWAYMWGSETDFYNFGPCAAMMNIQKNSEHSNICIEEILKANFAPDTTALDHMLLAKVYSRRRFTVFPSPFFNTEWLMSAKYVNGHKTYDNSYIADKTTEGWFIKNEYSNSLFEQTFAWHWHNSSNKNKVIQEGSKFDLLTKRTKKLLKERGILQSETV